MSFLFLLIISAAVNVFVETTIELYSSMSVSVCDAAILVVAAMIPCIAICHQVVHPVVVLSATITGELYP